MEITVIYGQNHKGSSYHVSRMVLESITNSDDIIHEFFLPKDGPDYCLGCYQCIQSDPELCPQSEKVQKISLALRSSHIILISSPTYCYEMTGQLKTLFDHLGYQWLSHRPEKEMFGKIGISISTTAGAGAKNVTQSISHQMFWWGIGRHYKLPLIVSAARWTEVSNKTKSTIEKKVHLLTKKINKSMLPVKPTLKTKLLFKLMKGMQNNNTWNPVDKQHWLDNQWLEGEKPWR